MCFFAHVKTLASSIVCSSYFCVYMYIVGAETQKFAARGNFPLYGTCSTTSNQLSTYTVHVYLYSDTQYPRCVFTLIVGVVMLMVWYMYSFIEYISMYNVDHLVTVFIVLNVAGLKYMYMYTVNAGSGSVARDFGRVKVMNTGS